MPPACFHLCPTRVLSSQAPTMSCEKPHHTPPQWKSTPLTVEALCPLPNLSCIHLSDLVPTHWVTFYSLNMPSLFHSQSHQTVSPCLETLFTPLSHVCRLFSSGIALNLTPAVFPDIILRHLPLLLLYTTLFSFSVFTPTYLCLDGNNNVPFCRRLPSIRLQRLQWQWLRWVSSLLPA